MRSTKGDPMMKKATMRLLALMVPTMLATPAFAQEMGSDNEYSVTLFKYLAAALAIGIAAIGGALGQGRAASAALEGIARNPSAADKLFTPMILALALIESLVIYALVVALLIIFA